MRTRHADAVIEPSTRPDGAGDRPLLEVRGLDVAFRTSAGPVRAVNGVDLEVGAGEIVGLVGESGSGKSVTSRAVMGLLPRRTSTIRGSIRFEGDELVGLPERAYRHVRGERVAMIFQDPMTALDPLYAAGDQVSEALRFHFGLSREAARTRVLELLTQVGLSDAAAVSDAYPHQLSGGMRQRVMIAMALACEPRLLIADEPTTALDVTIQAQILRLLRDLVHERGMALLLITHDLGVVHELCSRAVVLYAGRVVETAPVADLFTAPRHPYTGGLAASIPSIAARRRRLPQIPGTPPDPARLPAGCAFAPRCPAAIDRCRTEQPELVAVGTGRTAACHRSDEVAAGLTLELGRRTGRVSGDWAIDPALRAREGYVDYRGLRTWVAVVGDEVAERATGRSPLLLLHGGPGVPHDYIESLAALAATGRRVIFYDQQGCGNSDQPADPARWTIEHYLGEIRAVRDQLGLDRCHLLGQSWGGMLLMEYLVGRPSGVVSATLASAPSSMPAWMAEAMRLRAALPPGIQATMERHEAVGTWDDPEYELAVGEFYGRHLCRVVPFPEPVARSFVKLARNPQVYRTMNGPTEFHVTGTLRDWEILTRLDEVDEPVLLTSGRHDQATPAQVAALARRLPQAEWVLFEASGHMAHAEEPERYMAVVADFMARAELGGAARRADVAPRDAAPDAGDPLRLARSAGPAGSASQEDLA